MIRLLFILFVTVPLVELYVLIQVGSGIGGLNTIALCLLTAAIGGVLIRSQGLRILLEAQYRLRMGDLPAEHVLHGFLLALSGILLFTPGFITDGIGFALLVPPVRRWIIARFLPPRPPGGGGDGVIDAEIIDDYRHLP